LVLLSQKEKIVSFNRKGEEIVPILSEQEVYSLVMSPFNVIFAVASAEPSISISRRQIVRALEYGLSSEEELGEKIFDLLRMNLHEFFAEFTKDFSGGSGKDCFEDLDKVRLVLAGNDIPAEMAADFARSLHRLALFVAEGSIWEEEAPSASMKARAEEIGALFDL
jgi:hypothetical protein